MISFMISISSHCTADRVVSRTTRAIALCVGLLLGLVALLLLAESIRAVRVLGLASFMIGEGWYPSASEYVLWPMLLATLVASFGSVLLAVPLGLSTALLGRFYASPSLVSPLRRMMVVLAGIPSVVYGLWGLTVLVPWIARFEPPGASLLSAILVLTLMIVPTIALTSDAALSAIPADDVRAAAALGLSRTGSVLGVYLPAARSGIETGVMLALMRALGETMAVLMVAGNVVQLPSSLFAPVRVLTANIALEMPYAVDLHRSALFVSGLMLMLLVSVLAWLIHRRSAGRDA